MFWGLVVVAMIPLGEDENSFVTFNTQLSLKVKLGSSLMSTVLAHECICNVTVTPCKLLSFR